MDGDAAIVEMPAVPQRRADDKDREEVATGRDQPLQLPLHFVEHRVLKQQIIDRISREAELREHHQGNPGHVAGGEQAQDIGGVLPRVGDRDMRDARADADELVAVG